MRVAILGCGYVGCELARQLTPEHEVWGVRRSENGLEAVEAAGATPIQADLTDPTTLEALPPVDHVVFAASSGGRDAAAARKIYVQAQERVLDYLSESGDPPSRYVYTSSTGVYGDHDGDWVDEETPIEPTTEKTQVLARAEDVAISGAREHGIDGSVVRLAGLYGPDRYRLERYVEGPVTAGYLNMIHRADAAGVIAFLLEEELARNEVVLGVDEEPVEKWAFADWLAEACGRDSPPKRTIEERLDAADLSTAARRRLQTSKRCSNDKLARLGYAYQYPTYREGYQAAIEAYCEDS